MSEAVPDSRDPLPSWNRGFVKAAILDFVAQVTTEGTLTYKPPSQRIATFDNDGTLWCERPFLVQIYFLVDRIKAIAIDNPALANQQPFKAILENDRETIATFTKKELVALIFATHAGMPQEEFLAVAASWFNNAKHPHLQQLFKACIYQPMRELLDFLKAHEFKNYIVTGGGVDFVRVIADEIYGIPPEHVIGSSGKLKFELQGDTPMLTKLPELNSFNDREAKVENIALHIGLRPLLAFGNSDGDLAMLRYTAAGTGNRLALLLHHDDSDREYAYDRDFKISPLVEGLNVVPTLQGGMLVSMKQDWKRVFLF
ncbi:MAG TPA: haloacid dehalogenase-like hydrolase [Leptolyngbyaceae cyanobacterium M33_DOE_097]|uniref:Haloacid dehalogenase-like hydrolase n=1 Tax=Oscillatoriales cyanobacterium SpSt-418 TaxID=2282169 RepID=A0A7C3KKB6_9CYAN|nr:haloacid dehalogenase-like hydrolase [Leptolyngbyaceae cyanobacterium M33_DOE_097]